MIFPTIEFAAFFVVVLFASWMLMPNPRYWKPFIVAVSLAFYAYADWRWVGLLVFSVLANQLAATVITRTACQSRREQVLVGAIALNLGLLGVFKYFGFFVDSVNGALNSINLGMPLPLLELALPIGISFFTFQAISYVVDVYQYTFELAKPWDYAVYATFFPHLVAGPIVRAREFIPQLARPRSPRNLPVTPALFLITGGLIKKVVLADMLATRLVDPVFANPGAHSALDVSVGILGYAAQIYCDFSGYTDIAIGLAMLLGFRFPENFNRPYAAFSLQDFWHRWHMTLSRWLRDYVYIPLGGNRRGVRRAYVNLMITMLLGGLWHGAAWTFVVWGGIHGAGLCFEKWATRRRAAVAAAGSSGGPTLDLREPNRGVGPTGGGDQISTGTPMTQPTGRPAGTGSGAVLGKARTSVTRLRAQLQDRVEPTLVRAKPKVINTLDAVVLRSWPRWSLWLATFTTVAFAWVFFRAASVDSALHVFARLLTGWGEHSTLITPAVVVVLTVALGSQFVPRRVWRDAEQRIASLPLVAQGVGFGLVLVLMNAIIGQQGVAPFIYFQF
ncbi:MAG: MBOAT family O-acyltransferase [Candidatus Nanopelagicales bacterium]